LINYSFILKPSSNNLKIIAETNSFDEKSCEDLIQNCSIIKQEIAGAIINLPDSIKVDLTKVNSNDFSHKQTLKDSLIQIKKDVDKYEDLQNRIKDIEKTNLSSGKQFWANVSLLSGVLAGIITIVDANQRDNITTTVTNGYSTYSNTRKEPPRWEGRQGVFYTIDLTLSIGLITLGISNLIK